MAQDLELDGVIEKFDAYRIERLQEKIYVHTDRTGYLAGETVWFKIYYVDGVQHKPLSLSKVVYIDLLDSKGTSVLQLKVPLGQEAKGSGSFVIPYNLNSGGYTLRAYTNWMKNFSADFFFQQQLIIVNPSFGIDSAPISTQMYDVQFFPEGGNLVYGLESRVAFRAVDQDGKSIDFNGALIDESNDTIAIFEPFKFGIGSFNVKPQGYEYRALIVDSKGNSSVHKFPKPIESGYVMCVTNEPNNQVKITIHSINEDLVPEDGYVYLFIHTRQLIAVKQKLVLRKGVANINVNKDSLPDGISHLTVFDQNIKPVSERLYFKEPNDVLRINSKTNQPTYTLRDKILYNINIDSIDINKQPIEMSVSVFRIDSLNQGNHSSILSYLLLTSDLIGNIENPDYYVKNNDSVAIDNLMLTHGWRRFVWSEVLTGDHFAPVFVPELNGQFLNGNVLEKDSQNPLKEAHLFITAFGKSPQLHISKSNEKGDFFFELIDTNQKKILFQTNQNSILQITSPFSESKKQNLYPINITSTFEEDLIMKNIHFQVQNAFLEKQMPRLFADESPKEDLFFGSADKTYFLDAYVRFSTMEEVLREYVTEVAVRKANNKYRLLVLSENSNLFFKDSPLLVIDGVPVFDIDKFMKIDPRKIKSLEILKKKYFHGGLSFDGVLYFSSYQNDLADFDCQPDLILSYGNFRTQREFFSPVYESNNTLPDTRSLLFWSPNIKTDNTGNAQVTFYASDITGKYIVIVNGLSEDGRIGSASNTFEVIRE